MIYSAHTNPQYTVHNLGTGSAQVVRRREWTECIFFSISTHLPVTLLKFLKEKAEMTAYLIFIFQRRMVYSNLVSLNVPDKCCSNIITLKHKSYIFFTLSALSCQNRYLLCHSRNKGSGSVATTEHRRSSSPSCHASGPLVWWLWAALAPPIPMPTRPSWSRKSCLSSGSRRSVKRW